MTLITRAQWGAAAPRYRGNAISPKPLGVAIHWEGPKMGTFEHRLCAGKVRGIQRFHQAVRGWADIAYSYVVCPHGYVYEGRGLNVGPGANGTQRSNYDYYAVCAMVGKGDVQKPELLAGIKEAVAICRKKAGGSIKGHRDFIPTECPGAELYEHVRKGTFNTAVVRVVKKASRAVSKARPKITVAPVLRAGSTGAAVRRLQAGLNRVFPSYSRLAVDGDFGPRTTAVVREFQRRVGLTPDGVVGPKTRAALKRYGITF